MQYLSNILYWSFKDLFNEFTKPSNPFDILGTPLLYECYNIYHTKYNNHELSNEYSKLTTNIVNMNSTFICKNGSTNVLLNQISSQDIDPSLGFEISG